MPIYDYVIVGAGSAGCVLAARLSEDPRTSVLVLEAGPADDAPEFAIPAAAPTLWTGPTVWDDRTVPQRHAGDRSIYLPHGRVLGGGSSINGMVHVHGNRADYDAWRDEHGCDGWGADDMARCFRRAEEGPLRTTHVRSPHPLSQAWLDAARAYGLPDNDGFNGAEQEGVGLYRAAQSDGRRWSASDAYLKPAAERANVTIETGAVALAVIVEGGRATGVRYLRDGTEHEARAASEVVLCAGAIKSPQLLMLSGIGPADDLREHGIEPVVDSPNVGHGLQDHPLIVVEWHTDVRNLWEDATPESLERWMHDRSGPMASLGADAGGFVRTRDELPAPDLQLGAIPGPELDQEHPVPDRRGVALLVIAVHVGSRGRLGLRSADPLAMPAIDPAYLSDEADLDVLVAGVELARRIAACEPLASLTDGERSPGVDAQLRGWVREHVATSFHPTSTCAMGAADDAVCDPELRVRDVDGLRVVDASVMPAAPRGNTNGPAIAVAERAAELILGSPGAPRF